MGETGIIEPATRRITYFNKIKEKKEKVAMIYRRNNGDESQEKPELFLRLTIPPSLKNQFTLSKQEPKHSSRSGWFLFNTQDWKDIDSVFYYKTTDSGNPDTRKRTRKGFSQFILPEEEIVYKMENRTRIEMVLDKALKRAGCQGLPL